MRKLPEPDPREQSLPKWARTIIAQLRAGVEVAQRAQFEAEELAEAARLKTRPEDSKILLHRWEGGEIGLGNDATIRFMLIPRQEGNIRAVGVSCEITKDGHLEISGDTRIHLHPQDCTRVDIEVNPW